MYRDERCNSRMLVWALHIDSLCLHEDAVNNTTNNIMATTYRHIAGINVPQPTAIEFNVACTTSLQAIVENDALDS